MHESNSSREICPEIDKLFNKRYELCANEVFNLPSADCMFVGPPWKIKALQDLKNTLNGIKNSLNDVELQSWHSHTNKMNPAGEIQWHLRTTINPELLTQAWCKFYENVSSFPLIPQSCLDSGILTSVHLCEAPGAFITSLNHYLQLNHPKINWTWTASTMNPHYEGNLLTLMINDDRLILHTADHWYFGEDNTGDVMSLKNLEGLVKRGKTMLVTADGSISCLDRPAEQELVVAHLHYCEVIAALSILADGGSFLLKIFTIFEHQTVCLMYLLRCCFDRVILNKPATSKEGNSEVYVICLGFRGQERVQEHLKVLRGCYESGPTAPIFQREDLPEVFVSEITQASKFFMELQCEVIKRNVATFAEKDSVNNLRADVVKHFLDIYGIEWIGEEKEIVGKSKLEIFKYQIMGRKSQGSFNDRKRKAHMQEKLRLKAAQMDVRTVLAEGEFSFHLPNDPGPLKIILGKPFEKVLSSRFCESIILGHLSFCFEQINGRRLKCEFPHVKPKNRFLEEMQKENKRVYSFGYSPAVDPNLIRKVNEIVESIEEGQTIILLEYSLLTQLNLGILYLLGHAFEKLVIQLRQDLGSVVTLNNARKPDKVREAFREIIEAFETAKANNKVIVSIFPITKLCASELNPYLLTINHAVIKHIIDHLYTINYLSWVRKEN
ncbi:cap-specific mRNA (nucleoside-2'-O-)-methyltransferase 2 [Diachasmimorpha longicaudata]|uniref:cap-specific mRNA (nucleoside-2'-O-)-methyltransferase 2 n=1 Tax=Diachasmimorpha longicaudata TaxID=58733 RepID=UPI0030B8E81B